MMSGGHTRLDTGVMRDRPGPEEGTMRQSVVIFTEVIYSTASTSATASVSTSVASMVMSLWPASVLGRSDNNRASRVGSHGGLLRIVVIGAVQPIVHA